MTESKDIFKEKQDRREFLQTIGKVTLPAIAFIGFGISRNRISGEQKTIEEKSKPTMACGGTCSNDCKGGCSGGCDGKCNGLCERGGK